MADLIFKSYADLAKTLHSHLPEISAQKFDLIVGMPRSGMVPAYIIALDLNIAVCSFDEFINNSIGSRTGGRHIKGNIINPHDAKKVLIVEDSYNTGERLRARIGALPKELHKKVTTLAVYSATDTPHIDMYLELVPQPRVFEWNILHHEGITGYTCYDLDGVLCEDPTDEQNDDGSKYMEFIKNARPKYIPTYRIKTIVTSRLSKYKTETEAWLARNGVEYDNLVMLEGYTAEERRSMGIHGSFKAAEYVKDDYLLFIESNYRQALEINRLTGKPVYCIDANVMIDEPKIDSISDTPQDTIAHLKRFANRYAVLRTTLQIPYKGARKAYRYIKATRDSKEHNEKPDNIYQQIFPTHKLDKRTKVVNAGFGQDGNEYALSEKAIQKSSVDNYVVFSAGIFNDIEFEKFMISKYDAIVYSFDPTPLSAAFIKEQIKLKAVNKNQLVHTKCGVEAYDGSTEFNVEPDNDGGVGSSAINRADKNGQLYPRKIKVTMKTIRTLMKEKRLSHIDCMKLDIEGSEFAVIQHCFSGKNPLKVPNLIIEFHERFFEDGVEKMEQAFKTLREAGYVHVWTSKLGIECLFVHGDYL